jgi:hypothetical protein
MKEIHMFKTTGTFAEMLAQYEATKADMNANELPDWVTGGSEVCDALQTVYDGKVMFHHQAALALVEAPATSLDELLVKVRFMNEYQMDMTPSREGKAYVEILADLERLLQQSGPAGV